METIAAISTAIGNGGIGIIRMSGPKTFEIIQKIFRTQKKNKIKIEEIEGYTIRYGYIVNAKTEEILDEVLVSFFNNSKSYTKEDMCEINSHGGMIVEQLILEECIQNGAKLAEPGEFTKRAFLNGRIDLSQAESVIDIINSKTLQEEKAASEQLQGFLSQKIHGIMDKLLDGMADIEASIDYPEYDEVEVTNEKLMNRLEEVEKDLEALENSFATGKLLKEGIRTAIIGKPNAGKSSLLNRILKEDRAIVSDIEGTTRDTIEEFVTVKGVPLKIVDTAGIRKTKDKIEEIGVKKAIQVMEKSDLVLVLLDNGTGITKEDEEILNKLGEKKAIILINKTDLEDKHLEKEKILIEKKKPILKIVAQTGEGIEKLYEKIEEMFHMDEIQADKTIITNLRHKNQITEARKNIEKAMQSIKENLPVDMVAIPIKESLECLGKITGENISEDIIQEIFSKFCLGK